MAGFQECITFFMACSLIIFTYLFGKLFRNRPFNPPPGPLALPIIGHLHLLSHSPHKEFSRLSKLYGPIIRIFMGSVPCVVVSSPDMAREFLRTHEISFCNRPQLTALHYLSYDAKDFAFAPYGPYWKFMKKLSVSELLGGRTLEMLLPIREDEVKGLIQSLARNARDGKAVEIRGEFISLINNVITRTIMSTRCSGQEDEARKVRKIIDEASEISKKITLSDIFWFCKRFGLSGITEELRSIRDRYDEMMESIIEERHEVRRKQKLFGDDSGTVKDLLDILIDTSEDENSEFRLTRENIKGFIMDVFTGGTDTTTIAAEWALAELINHPNVMEKARQEIDLVVGRNRLVQESDIPKLSYLQAIFKETLRLHPPSGPFLMRESSEDTKIAGYDIPAKTRLIVNVWAIGRDPTYWENPLEYRPERFLTEEGTLKDKLDVRGQNYLLLPFGSGRRGCPGASLAMKLIQTSLAAMIQCFEWNAASPDVEEVPDATLAMAHPLVCHPVERLSPLTEPLF